MRDFSSGPEWLSINTATLRKQWRLDRIVDECARRGIRTIAPWRDQVAAVGLAAIARQLREAGVGLSGYCRGGFFPAADAAGAMASKMPSSASLRRWLSCAPTPSPAISSA